MDHTENGLGGETGRRRHISGRFLRGRGLRADKGAGLYPAVELPEIPDITAESVYDETAANALEQSLEALRRGTFDPGLPETKTWRGNDAAPLAEDYNRIEGACLRLYQTLTQQAQARPRLAIILGGVQF